jgi:cytidyltransferase-like protein
MLVRLTQVGHAGAMLQARKLGTELVVGIHSDEEILEHKGPTVMTLEERFVTWEEDLYQRMLIVVKGGGC